MWIAVGPSVQFGAGAEVRTSFYLYRCVPNVLLCACVPVIFLLLRLRHVLVCIKNTESLVIASKNNLPSHVRKYTPSLSESNDSIKFCAAACVMPCVTPYISLSPVLAIDRDALVILCGSMSISYFTLPPESDRMINAFTLPSVRINAAVIGYFYGVAWPAQSANDR